MVIKLNKLLRKSQMMMTRSVTMIWFLFSSVVENRGKLWKLSPCSGYADNCTVGMAFSRGSNQSWQIMRCIFFISSFFFFIHRSRNTVALLFCPLNPTIEHVLFFFLFIFIFFFCAPTVAERHMAMTIKISDIPVLLSDIVASIPIQWIFCTRHLCAHILQHAEQMNEQLWVRTSAWFLFVFFFFGIALTLCGSYGIRDQWGDLAIFAHRP